MTHRGPFQPLLFCDSVNWSCSAGNQNAVAREELRNPSSEIYTDIQSHLEEQG